MDYAALASTANTLIKGAGLSVTITRNGVKVTTAYAVFVGGETKNETSSGSSVLASTAMTTKSVLLSGLAKAPQVGDLLVAEKFSMTVQKIETLRPAATTILYKLEVI